MLLNTSGKLTFLRVNEDSGFGPAEDFIDVEVVILLDSEPGRAFGFQLRNDNYLPARRGYLDLLRDAFNQQWTTNIDYRIDPGRNNAVICRVWLTK